jgi:hypothetical protein
MIPGQREEGMLRKVLFIVLLGLGLMVLLWLLLTVMGCRPSDREERGAGPFLLEEATISQIHAAFQRVHTGRTGKDS